MERSETILVAMNLVERAPRCSCGPPGLELLQGMVPALQDKVALCRERLRICREVYR